MSLLFFEKKKQITHKLVKWLSLWVIYSACGR
jgi:hypothetical protein